MRRRETTFILLFLSCVCLFITSCNESLYPIDVAEGFWRAVKDKDTKAIQKYSTNNSLKEDEPGENILPLDEITLGKTVIDGETAWVDTMVTISGDKPFTIPLRTELIRENKRWKVDYDATIKLVSQGSAVSNVINSIRNMSKDLAEELNQSMEEMQKAIPEVTEELNQSMEEMQKAIPEVTEELNQSMEDIQKTIPEVVEEVEKIEESLLEHVPELKKQIEEFIRDLKDALEELGKEPGETTATET